MRLECLDRFSWVSDHWLNAEVLNNAKIGERKNMNLPGVMVPQESVFAAYPSVLHVKRYLFPFLDVRNASDFIFRGNVITSDVSFNTGTWIRLICPCSGRRMSMTS